MKKNKKTKFSIQYAKWGLLITSFIIIATIGYLAATPSSEKIVQSEDRVIPSTNISSQNNIQLTSSNSPKIFSPNLSKGNGVYVLSKSAAPCKDYQNTTVKERFGFRCKTSMAIYRGYWTKKIDVTGYNKLRVKANISVNNYTDTYFNKCNNKGIGADDSINLLALSKDPNPKLGSECNHAIDEDGWHHCYIDNEDTSVITHCGLPQCTSNRTCDMSIDVSGKNEIYLLFSVYDNWFADIEGSLSDMKITLTK